MFMEPRVELTLMVPPTKEATWHHILFLNFSMLHHIVCKVLESHDSDKGKGNSNEILFFIA